MEGQDGREKGVGDDDPVGEAVHSFGGERLLGPGLEFSERCREDVADSDISAQEDAEVFGSRASGWSIAGGSAVAARLWEHF